MRSNRIAFNKMSSAGSLLASAFKTVSSSEEIECEGERHCQLKNGDSATIGSQIIDLYRICICRVNIFRMTQNLTYIGRSLRSEG